MFERCIIVINIIVIHFIQHEKSKETIGGAKSLIFQYKLKRAPMAKRVEILRPLFYHLGENVELYTTSFGTEPYLINIEDNVCVAADVHFITHDVSCFRMANYLNVRKKDIDKVGCITLKDNCFVGAFSILMPNIVIGRNSVIAAGFVVTKNVPDGEVWGGNPAHFIMKTEEYANKLYNNCRNWPWMENRDNLSKNEIIKMRQDYFFRRNL